MMIYFEVFLLLFIIVCAIAVSVTENLLAATIVYMAFSLVTSIIWVLIQSPDLAITEAAVGAGITSLLLFLVLRNINQMGGEEND